MENEYVVARINATAEQTATRIQAKLNELAMQGYEYVDLKVISPALTVLIMRKTVSQRIADWNQQAQDKENAGDAKRDLVL